jgi:putative PEP-CTERM system histidine kinase
VKNAPRHRNNPAFIDDMINTTDHAVRKMSRLVDHIRRPGTDDEDQLKTVNLTNLVTELVAHHQHQTPAPRLEGDIPDAVIKADLDQLRSVLGHLVQNAQDATPPNGEITIALKIAKGNAVLFIQDSGTGMSREFIANQLFKPFESTKGLTGMGIGAYQAREYVRKIGGNIDVTSEPGIGSCFSVQIPLADETETTQDSGTLEPAPVTHAPIQGAN